MGVGSTKMAASSSAPRLVLAAVAALAGSNASGVTPIQQAVSMLNDMLVKAKEGMHEEQVQYAAFKQFCDDATYQKQQMVQEADEKIEMLQAHLQKFTTEAERLGEEVLGHQGDIETWEGEQKANTEQREKDRADFGKMQKDYQQSLSAIKQAIESLKKQAFDRPQEATALLLQAKAVLSHLSPSAGRAIDAFLESAQEPDLDFVGNSPPEANAYEFQSSHIIDLLDGLEDKFRDELTKLEKEEMENRHNYESVMQDLRASVTAGKASITAKEKSEARNKQDAADANADLKDTQSTRTDDNAYLEDLVGTCQQKATDFDARRKLRGEEVEALSKALEILQGNKAVANSADAVRPGAAALLSRKSTSLAQLRATRPAQAKAAAFLAAASERLHSRVLEKLAVRVRDDPDPFAKVKTLIEELVAQLEAQAAEEADHKSWCDAELSANKETRTTKSEEVEMLHGEVDKLTSDIAVLGKEIGELHTAVAEIVKNVAKTTELRNKEKAENEATLQDAKDGQTAMTEVISILEDFYQKAGESTVFAQARRQPSDAPPVFSAPFQGTNQDASSGIVGMLQVLQSDFARLESDTATAEDTASSEYDAFMETSSTDKAAKEKDIEDKGNERTTKEGDLLDAQTDLENVQKELDSAMKYYEKLKPSCVDSGMSYEERVGRREEEIQSLKEALTILSGEVHGEVIQGVMVKDQASAGPLRSATSGVTYD